MYEDTTSVPSQPSIGPALAAARKRQGLSVEDVAAATRIRAQLIRQIEKDDFASCGGAVYARGHITSIARVVGLDPAELVAEFDRRAREEPTSSATPMPGMERDRDLIRVRRSPPGWSTIALAVLALVVVFLTVGVLMRGEKGASGLTRQALTPSQSAAPKSSVKPTTVAPRPSHTAPSPTQGGVRLRIEAVARAWVKVMDSSNRTLYQRTLTAGQSIDLVNPDPMRVVFGNAAATRVFVNGQSVSPPCQRSVCSATFPFSAAG